MPMAFIYIALRDHPPGGAQTQATAKGYPGRMVLQHHAVAGAMYGRAESRLVSVAPTLHATVQRDRTWREARWWQDRLLTGWFLSAAMLVNRRCVSFPVTRLGKMSTAEASLH